MSDVVEVNELAPLADFRSQWESLLTQTPGADFFRTLDWLEVYWRHYGEAQRLRLLIIHEAGEAVGFVPLVVRRERTKSGPFNVLTYPLDDWGSFYGPIGPNPSRLLAVALEYILATKREWDFLELRWADTGTSADNYVAGALRHAGAWRARRRLHTEIPVAKLDGTWDEYWASRSGSWRSVFRRNEKKLARAGRYEFVRYRPSSAAEGEGDPRWDMYGECERLAASSWQGSSTSGTTLTHATVGGFLRDVHAAAARAGCLDVNLLTVDGRTAAFVYNYVYQGYVSSLRLGFDPQFRQYGVGTVLMGYLLRDSFERGDRLFDFLPGSLDAKRRWQTALAKSYRYAYCRPGVGRIQFLAMKRWLDDWLLSRSLVAEEPPLNAPAEKLGAVGEGSESLDHGWQGM